MGLGEGVLGQLLSLDLWTAQSMFPGTISKVCDSALANMWYGCPGSHSLLEAGLPCTQYTLPLIPQNPDSLLRFQEQGDSGSGSLGDPKPFVGMLTFYSEPS